MAASSGNVSLGLSWKGPYTYGRNWDISALDVKMPGVTTEIQARINKDLPSNDEQVLKFITQENSGNVFLDHNTRKVVDRLTCSLELAKTIKMSARIFQVYENRSRGTMNSDGRITYERRARRDNLTVHFDSEPELIPDQTYLIQVENNEGSLRGTFHEWSEEDAQAAQQHTADEERFQMGKAQVRSGMNRLRMMGAGGDLSECQLEGMLRGLQAMGQAAAGTRRDPSLDGDDVETLQAKLADAETRLQTARESLAQALASGNADSSVEKLAEKQAVMQEVISLKKALQEKGVVQEGEDGCTVS